MGRSPYERARRLARDVLRECGADEPHKIDPFAIVGRRNISVKYGKLEGATARVFHLDGRAIIRISHDIVQEGRLRFSVAHEVGHFLLGHRIPSHAELDGNRDPFYNAHQEREADAFAVEHNTPEAWTQPFSNLSPSMDTVRTIARTFRSSIVASAMRYVELTSGARAVAYSERGCVKWAKTSRAFRGRVPPQMRVGAGALAFDYHERGELDTRARVVPARAWLGVMARVSEDIHLSEHAELVREPGWGCVLSLLWVASPGAIPIVLSR